MSTPISIVVRASTEHRYSISTNHADSVLDLKKKIALQDATPPERVRLVYSGRVLKDTNTLGSYKIADGHTIHLVRSPNIPPPLSAPPSTTASSPSIPMSTSSPAASTATAASTTTSGAATSSHDTGSFPNLWAHTMRSNSDLSDLGIGAPGRLNSPGNRDTMNPVIMSQMMQDPNFAQYMSSMLQNPQIIESMLALNPFLQAMGPQAGEMLRSSQFQAMISDPETLRRVARMGSQMGCPGGTQSADTTESVGPTSSTWAGAESTVGLSSSSATRTTTTPAAANELALNAESTASLMPNYWIQQVGALRASLGAPSPSAVRHEPVGFEERYQVELKKLNEMGFWDAAKNVRALVASSGNLNGAIELLFSGAI